MLFVTSVVPHESQGANSSRGGQGRRGQFPDPVAFGRSLGEQRGKGGLKGGLKARWSKGGRAARCHVDNICR